MHDYDSLEIKSILGDSVVNKEGAQNLDKEDSVSDSVVEYSGSAHRYLDDLNTEIKPTFRLFSTKIRVQILGKEVKDLMNVLTHQNQPHFTMCPTWNQYWS